MLYNLPLSPPPYPLAPFSASRISSLHKLQPSKRKESRGGIEPRSPYLPTSLTPYLLGQTGSCSAQSLPMGMTLSSTPPSMVLTDATGSVVLCSAGMSDFPLLVPAPFLSLVPLHGMTSPFLSDRNTLWTLSGQTLRHLFPAMLSSSV